MVKEPRKCIKIGSVKGSPELVWDGRRYEGTMPRGFQTKRGKLIGKSKKMKALRRRMGRPGSMEKMASSVT